MDLRGKGVGELGWVDRKLLCKKESKPSGLLSFGLIWQLSNDAVSRMVFVTAENCISNSPL